MHVTCLCRAIVVFGAFGIGGESASATTQLFVSSPEEAAAALLGSGRHYDDVAVVNLGSYDSELISVPQRGSQAVNVVEGLPGDAKEFLVDFEAHLLLNEEEWGQVCEKAEHVGCYTDPKLEHNDVNYFNFVERLQEAGLLVFTRRPISRVGIFCVQKKNKKLRIVSDCRATNRRFRPTPHLPMGTGVAWSEVGLAGGCDAWISLLI